MKEKIKSYLKLVPYIIIVGLLIVMFFMTKCQSSRETAYITEISNYKDSIKTYIDRQGDLVAYNTTLELNTREQLAIIEAKDKQLFELQKSFKDVKSATSIKVEVLIHDTIKLPVKIPCDFEPISAIDSCDYYKIVSTVSPDFFILDTLQMFDNQSIVIGTKKRGFFKPAQSVVEVKHSNPYFITKAVGSYVVERKKAWYEKGLFKFSVGVVAGIVINNKLKP